MEQGIGTQEFTQEILYRMDESWRMISICLHQLTDQEVWLSPNDASNSVANLMQHLAGNIRQYAIASLGNRPDRRERDLEFIPNGNATKAELSSLLFETISEAKDTLNSTSTTEWMRKRTVQGFSMTGVGIAIHVTEHLSYHTGQITLLTKLLKNEDLGFYDGFDLNQGNQ